MTAINYANLTTYPNDVVFSIVNTRASIADPRDSDGNRKFVYNAEPFHKAMDFSNFPYIIVKMPRLTQVQSSADNKYKWLSYIQTIIVRTAKEGSGGGRTDAGHSDMQTITDSVFKTFNDTTIKGTLKTNNLFHSELELVNQDDTPLQSQQAVYETEYTLTYNTRLKVVA